MTSISPGSEKTSLVSPKIYTVTEATDGESLKGVCFHAGEATTQSLMMRSLSGTVRLIEAHHQLAKLNEISSIDYA